MRKLEFAVLALLLIAGIASAEEIVVPYSEWKSHAVELAVDMGYVEVRVKFASRAEMSNKEACVEFLKKEVQKLASGKVVPLSGGYTFEFKGGTPIEGHGEGTGHNYYNKVLIFGMEAKVDGKSITAKGQ